MSRRWYLLAGLCVGGGVVALVRLARLEVPAAVEVGTPAPEVVARRLGPDAPGLPARLSEYRGRVVLLNIWATWCDPCRREMPSIERLYRELGPRGLAVVAVSIDDAGAEADIRAFVREYGLSFEIWHDPTGGVQQAYQLIGVPQSFVIDRRGVIRKKTFEADWSEPANRLFVAGLLDQ